MTTCMNWALKESLKGRHETHKMGAVLYKGGRVIARRSNMSRPFGCSNRGFHAEERLIKCCDKKHLKGAVMFIARTNNSMSRPCAVCWALIRSVGIKKVVYRNWDKTISVERVGD